MAAVAERRFFYTFTARDSHEGSSKDRGEKEEAAPPMLGAAEKEAKLTGGAATATVADDDVDAVETAKEQRALSFSLSRRLLYIHAVRASGYAVLMKSSPDKLTEKIHDISLEKPDFPGKKK